jgi:NAD(P)-dependent dehydrogenase (short-subunit alcohol dehydrogenase family)
MEHASRKPVCVIAGVGPGNGAAFARRFAAEGYAVALLARNRDYLSQLEREISGAKAFPCDVGDAAAVEQTFKAVASELGPVDTVVYNAGSGVWGSIEDVSAEDFERSWRTNALGAFLMVKQVLPTMKEAGKGNIVFIGATASRRGGARAAAFAPAKAALRTLAESLARSLGSKGIHVAHVVIDGVIDIPRTRQRLPDKPDDFFLKPAEIADAVFMLTQQKRSAWTFELEVRPFGEVW